ncbi:hypothetical protein EUTSA_v10024117mg [Eutrema salsugineum]|uniref:Uncharacterized protein n=2 Tax=Eutrema salsugineum TaxID=72664 RepID=V4MCR9_EUTSA|nr:hypothetical protein EUTSA_v10024117mg [Eutrema salsugineum]
MFLLCDDISCMLRFCFKLWKGVERDLKPDSPVGQRLLRVMHFVYSRSIKPKNGVHQIGERSLQWEMIRESFDTVIRDLHKLCFIREINGLWVEGRELTSRIEEALKKVEEKFRCAKDVSEANGFVREAIKSNIWDLWKSLFDKETEEAWTQKVIRHEILCDMFQPFLKKEEEEEGEAKQS